MPPKLHFTVLAPSPTTIEYKVSTASPPLTLQSLCLQYLSLLLRSLLGASIIIALALRLWGARNSWGEIGEVLQGWVDGVEILWFGGFVLIGGYLVTRRWYCEESLLVLRTLGIQTTTLSSSYLLPATTRFIPTSQIRDIFIHEAFRGFEVRFYLCVVVEGEGEAVVVFPKLLPNRHILEQVWRGARECLYEPKG